MDGPVHGETARWSRYELVNGVVRSAPDATLGFYEPWDVFNQNRGKYRTVEQPYAPLLDLNRKLKELEAQNVRPTIPGFHPKHLGDPIIGSRNDADVLIVEWCNQNGLLGLLPVLSNSIRTPAEINQEYELIHRVQATHYFKHGGFWRGTNTLATAWGPTSEDATTRAVKIAEEYRAGVTWWNWRTRSYEEKPLDFIELFFRAIWDEQPVKMSCPNTHGSFWPSYGEPLQDFVDWCEYLSDSITTVSNWTGEGDEDATRTFDQSLWLLSGLADSAATTFVSTKDRREIKETRFSAGLLSSYALMFLRDHIEGRRAIRCENCQRYFVSNDRQAKYCSPRCRNTAQGRRSRAFRGAFRGLQE